MYRRLKNSFRRKKLFLLCACVCVSITLWILLSLEEFDKTGKASMLLNGFVREEKHAEVKPVSLTTVNKSEKDTIFIDNDDDNNDNNVEIEDGKKEDDDDKRENEDKEEIVMLVRAGKKDDNKEEKKTDKKEEDSHLTLSLKDVAGKEKPPDIHKEESEKTLTKIRDTNSREGNEQKNVAVVIMDNQAKNNNVAKSNETKISDQIDIAIKRFQEKTKSFENLSQEGIEAHRSVLTALEKDKNDTHEIDLSQLNPKTEVSFPPFIEYGVPGDPGEGGKGVNKDPVKDNDLRMNEPNYQINEFSLVASEQIAVHRTLWDIRNDKCKEEAYDVPSIPPCSVVLVFHDEAWTTLLRSIHSIIDRTPTTALLEIVLIDDNSDPDYLKTPLEVYIKPLKIVRLIRASKRLGLIKARNLGFLYAKGEIIIFLDSHIECFPGWLEPLVTPIVEDPRTVTFPTIPIIDRDSFSVSGVHSSALGTLKIHSLTFTWYMGGKGTIYEDSPTMPGGLYAISRSFFQYLGAYDPELLFWGGENLEISFKIWMCGGRVLTTACSCVAHVFRKNSPFHSHDLNKAINKNSLRVADIWLDEYKHFYLEKFTYSIGEVGDTRVQRQLRKSLQCKNFRWYLDNVNHHLKKQIDADGIYSGQIKNVGADQCLVTGTSGAMTDVPYLMPCNMLHYRQVWQHRTDGFLTMYDKMMCSKSSSNANTPALSMKAINVDHVRNSMQFDYDQSGRLVTKATKLCLDIDPATPQKNVILSLCSNSTTQRWTIQTRRELQEFHKKRGVPGIEW